MQKAVLTVEPAPAPRMFVGGLVIDDHMDLLVFRNDIINGAQEFQPFVTAMRVVAHRDYLAFERVECGEQLGPNHFACSRGSWSRAAPLFN